MKYLLIIVFVIFVLFAIYKEVGKTEIQNRNINKYEIKVDIEKGIDKLVNGK